MGAGGPMKKLRKFFALILAARVARDRMTSGTNTEHALKSVFKNRYFKIGCSQKTTLKLDFNSVKHQNEFQVIPVGTKNKIYKIVFQ